MSLIKYFVAVSLSVTVLVLLYYAYTIPSYLYTPQVHYSPSSEDIVWQNGLTNCHGLTKWAIVTSEGNKTTPGMVKILISTQDWCLLIIGKYPNVWTVPSGLNTTTRLIYMSIADLQALPYMLARYTAVTDLPNWKNIGYLYAIERGARTIYDADENNLQLNAVHLQVVKHKQQYESPILSENQLKGNLLWNPLPSYFQQQDSLINRFLMLIGWRPRTSTTIQCLPIVQHYLAVLDPGNETNTHITIAPKRLVVPRGIFSPYDARSTIHMYEALWSLYLPATVMASLQTVWRSYIAQSLFYLIPDACLMFVYPASLDNTKVASSDNDMSYSDELLKLVKMLKYFPMTFNHFEDALPQLYQHLVSEGLIGVKDYKYVKAWRYDLKNIGYTFPKLPEKSKLWTRDVQLCIMFNWGSTKYTIRMLVAYYMRFFNSILLLIEGELPSEAVEGIPSSVRAISVETGYGWYQQRSLLKCLQYGNSNVTSYLYIADDMFINISMLSTLPTSKVWLNEPHVYKFSNLETFYKDPWPWWKYPPGERNFLERFVAIVNDLPYEWKQILSQNIGFPNRIHSNAVVDILHIPRALISNLTTVLVYLMNRSDIFCEILVPLALDIAGPQDHVYFMEGNLWNKDRLKVKKIMEFARTRHFVHSLKLSTRFGSDMWCMLMSEQIEKNSLL